MPLTQEDSLNLQRITEQKLKKMFEDKKEIPKLLIPKQLPNFIKTKTYIGFVEAVYQYCLDFHRLLSQYNDLRSKISNRVSDETSLLRKEKEDLAKQERQVSYHYSAIIISFNTQCLQEERHRSNFKDQVFFEALIYLIERVMKEMFKRDDFELIQEEINRLFRTNRYNLIKKRHQNDHILHKYPALKDYKNNNNLTNILTRVPERITAFKKYEKQKRNKSTYDYTRTLGLSKEPQSPDMEQRSPLLCTWLPSRKSMLDDFSKISSYNNYLAANEGKKYETFNTSENQENERSHIASLGSNLMNFN